MEIMSFVNQKMIIFLMIDPSTQQAQKRLFQKL
jgi:hypothetical protein